MNHTMIENYHIILHFHNIIILDDYERPISERSHGGAKDLHNFRWLPVLVIIEAFSQD